MHTIPPPDRLREEARIQAEVQNRLRQLAENGKPGTKKVPKEGELWMSLSERGSSGQLNLYCRVKIKTEFKKSVVPIQLMAGCCRTIREESNVHTRKNLLDYVINLLEDAQDFSWSSAKVCHVVRLCRMEQGKVQSWNETEKMDRIW